METMTLLYMPSEVEFGIVGKKDGMLLIQIFMCDKSELRLRFSLS